jgi:hypothetical protein
MVNPMTSSSWILGPADSLTHSDVPFSLQKSLMSRQRTARLADDNPDPSGRVQYSARSCNREGNFKIGGRTIKDWK